jgi:hypothetical protein
VIDFLADVFSLACYLLVGTLYARANAQRCYSAAAKKWASRNIDLVNASYRERVALHVLAWPIVWPTQLIGRTVDAPVGDMESAYSSWKYMQEQVALARKELE